MKLIGSILIASAFAGPKSWFGNSPSKDMGPMSGSPQSGKSQWDRPNMEWPMRSPKSPKHERSEKSPKSGHAPHSPHSSPHSPMDGKNFEMIVEKLVKELMKQTGDKHHGNGCTDCGGSSVNSNYAPVNTNVQNFVNIETEIDTNINVNMGGGKPMKPHGDKPNKGDWEKPSWEKPEWNKPQWGDKDESDFDGEMGWEVNNGEVNIMDIVKHLALTLGIESESDLKKMCQEFLMSIGIESKAEFKDILMNTFMKYIMNYQNTGNDLVNNDTPASNDGKPTDDIMKPIIDTIDNMMF